MVKEGTPGFDLIIIGIVFYAFLIVRFTNEIKENRIINELKKNKMK